MWCSSIPIRARAAIFILNRSMAMSKAEVFAGWYWQKINPLHIESNDVACLQFEEATQGGFDVAQGIVGIGKIFSEEEMVQFGEGGPFETKTARKLKIIRRLDLGADALPFPEVVGNAGTDEFRTDDVFIVCDVVAHHKLAGGDGFRKLSEDVPQILAFGQGLRM